MIPPALALPLMRPRTSLPSVQYMARGKLWQHLGRPGRAGLGVRQSSEDDLWGADLSGINVKSINLDNIDRNLDRRLMEQDLKKLQEVKEQMNLIGCPREFRAMMVEKQRRGILGPPLPNKRGRKSKKFLPTVSPRQATANLELLRHQNSELAEERHWAHLTPYPSEGELLLRKPIELQIWHIPEYRQILERKLDPRLQHQLMRQPPQVVALYTVAEDFLRDRMKMIYNKCKDSRGRNAKLTRDDMNLLELYQNYMDTWQQVVYITDRDSRGGSRGVTINRPRPECVGTLWEERPEVMTREKERFKRIFGSQVLYAGAPTVEVEVENKVSVGERGSRPSRPRTREEKYKRRWRPVGDDNDRIYASDIESACDSVESLGACPGHFRIIQGSREWAPGEVEAEIDAGLWFSVAASRSLILKHCVGLPKPLWHEIMEMVGDGALETSELEVRKRKESSDF
ncbi:hypothetical protein AAMO2058_001193700 [Amorphochlora amoebiformis]